MKRAAPDWAWRASLEVISTVPEICALPVELGLAAALLTGGCTVLRTPRAAGGWLVGVVVGQADWLLAAVAAVSVAPPVVAATVITGGLSKASARSAIWSPDACPALESPEAPIGAAEATCALAALASAARPMYSYDSPCRSQSLSEPPRGAWRAASLFVTSSKDPAVGDGCREAEAAVWTEAIESGDPNRK